MTGENCPCVGDRQSADDQLVTGQPGPGHCDTGQFDTIIMIAD